MMPEQISKEEARTVDCWRVGVPTDLRDDDPFFSDPSAALVYADKQSNANTTTLYGIWHYDGGTDATTLPWLTWLYLDGECFLKEG